MMMSTLITLVKVVPVWFCLFKIFPIVPNIYLMVENFETANTLFLILSPNRQSPINDS
jgi:hypothetical protein